MTCHKEYDKGTKRTIFFFFFIQLEMIKKFDFASTKCKIALESAHLAPRPSSFSALQDLKHAGGAHFCNLKIEPP